MSVTVDEFRAAIEKFLRIAIIVREQAPSLARKNDIQIGDNFDVTIFLHNDSLAKHELLMKNLRVHVASTTYATVLNEAGDPVPSRDYDCDFLQPLHPFLFTVKMRAIAAHSEPFWWMPEYPENIAMVTVRFGIDVDRFFSGFLQSGRAFSNIIESP